MDPVCQDTQQRRSDVLEHPTLNGIDFVEVDAADHRLVRVFFLKPVPPANAADPSDVNDAYGIRADLSRVTVTGGERILGVQPQAAERQPDGSIRLTMNYGGDYSVYTLTINVPELDPYLRRIPLFFMASCPVDFDCRQVPYCPPETPVEPALDYMAKDYSSFRRMMLDLLPQLNPGWIERNPSDLGIALVELLAYTGDRLSYFQDAVANEAYLETARQRISARRHARLVDYRMHDGRNAWTWVHLRVDGTGFLPQHTKFITRITGRLANQIAPPGLVIDESLITVDTLERDPALASAAVFETAHPMSFDFRNNTIYLHTWGNDECCLSPGTQEALLFTVPEGSNTADRPVLLDGDYLLIEEVKGPRTGNAADADPDRRQVVRIEGTPLEAEDPLYTSTVVDGVLQRNSGADPTLPLLQVRWRREDALTFPFCISARVPGSELLRNVSVARGNLVLADHGITTHEVIAQPEPVPGDLAFRLPLAHRPLTMQAEPADVEYDPLTGELQTARTELDADVRSVRPAVSLLVTEPSGSELWTAVPDLLDSPTFAQHFVAETDNDGNPILRFGDGEYGREVAGATSFHAIYRVGNGASGNIGAESIAHAAISGPAGWILGIRNPLAARGGLEPETIEEVRQHAPEAFRAEQFRAVTEADYAVAAQKLSSVAGAVATFRWTGSWYTVFVGIDPRDPADLVKQPRGLSRLSDRLATEVRAFLTRYRLAGYDLEIRPPRFVPLEIELDICVAPGHFRGDVKRAVIDALSNRVLPDGTRGFFHPDNFTFGDPVYLSRLYAAVERVEGVESALVRVFRRYGQRDNGELQVGVLTVGPWEIALLDNDPNFMENGSLIVVPLGGKG